MTHPNLRTRRPREPADVLRAMVYTPIAGVAAWVESELSGDRVTYQVARSIEQIVAGLTEDPPPRAQLLVADFDAMEAVDVLQLHDIRERGWFGIVIGLGRVSPSLLSSLAMDRALLPPYRQGLLADAVADIGITRVTTRIAILPDR